jgi:hypothetical protein
MRELEITLEKNVYFPGEEVKGWVILKVDNPIKFRDILLEVKGLERTSVGVWKEDSDDDDGSTYTCYHSTNYVIDLCMHLAEGGELPPGEHTYPIWFQVPPNALPTYSGNNTDVSYLIRARVDVPWWFDVRTQKSFCVQLDPDIVRKMRKKVSAASKHFIQQPDALTLPPDNQDIKKPRPGILVELDRDAYLAGEQIFGRITILNPKEKRIRKVDVVFTAKEYAWAEGHTKYITVEKYKSRIGADQILEGVPSSFSIPIPRKVKTSFSGSISRLDWSLEFNVDIAFGFDVKAACPISIYQWGEESILY